jgi:hypothetical protein
MDAYWFILGILGTWRVTHLLSAEDGPSRLLARFRQAIGAGFVGTLFNCFYCLSVWIALPFALAVGQTLRHRLLLWPALSAGSILLERFSARDEPAAPAASYVEDPEPEE